MANNIDPYGQEWAAPTPESVIEQAFIKLVDDAGSLFEFHVLEAFKAIYRESPASYARYRLQAKESKRINMTEFDRLTAKTSLSVSENQQIEQKHTYELFYPLELWEEPVNGEQLLDEIYAAIKQYVIADEETLIASTLWVAYTWFIDSVFFAPIANITAPEKRCGKTRLLSVLKRLSYKAFITSNISAASLFRLVEAYKPTLLIDEADSFIDLHEDMRGIINAGFTREGAFIVRCVGEDLEPTPFNVWGAKAICGIGKIADTLQDRSIPLKLRRKIAGETVKNIDKSDSEQWAILRAKLARIINYSL